MLKLTLNRTGAGQIRISPASRRWAPRVKGGQARSPNGRISIWQEL